MKNKKLLVVFDFDGTLVADHTHNAIIKAKDKAKKEAKAKNLKEPPEYINGSWDVVRDFSIIGSMDTWKNIFETLKQEKHYVAIASFNAFGEIIPEFLDKMELDQDHIKKINIITGLPADPKTANKNEYIQQAIQDAIKESGGKKDFSGNPEDVILIDDSINNIKAAKLAGYQVIHAKKDGSHLTEIQEKLEELKKLEEKAPPVDRNAKPKKQLSESELLELEIKTLEKQREKLENQRKEHLHTINELKSEKNPSEENLKAISTLYSELGGMELASKEKYDYVLKLNEQLAAIVVDHDIKPKHLETNSENQGAVPKKKLNADKPQINRQERSDQIPNDWSKAISEPVSEPTQQQKKLEDLLKAQPKKAALWKNSAGKQSEVSTKKTAFLNELNEKLQAKQAMQGTSTLFGSGNTSTSGDKTKTHEKETKRKEFSR